MRLKIKDTLTISILASCASNKKQKENC